MSQRMPLRQKPMPEFRRTPHYLIFGPKSFDCPYTFDAVDEVRNHGKRAWLRKVEHINMLYFPDKGDQPVRTRFDSYPQIYQWKPNDQHYGHIGGLDALQKHLRGGSIKKNAQRNGDCNSCG